MSGYLGCRASLSPCRTRWARRAGSRSEHEALTGYRSAHRLSTWGLVHSGIDLAARRRTATLQRSQSVKVVARDSEIFKLVTVLDELRESYELAKGMGHAELQAHLMHARRLLLDGLQHNLKLYSELLELQARLTDAETQVERLRRNVDPVVVAVRGIHHRPRKPS